MIKGLFIKQPWIDLILDGKKSWEIRGSNTKIRGRIALIESGTGEVKGYVDLTDSLKVEDDFFDSNSDKHQIPSERFNSKNMPYKNTHAWVFKNPRRLKKGIKFKMKQGCVIWINLFEDEIIKESKS